MKFMKKKEIERRRKVSESNKARYEKARQKKAQVMGEIIAIGRRIFELALLATNMWCNACEVALSFRFVEEERQQGLASVFKIRCNKCLTLYDVASSSPISDNPRHGPPLYAVNCKFALGCLDSGVGHEQLNKLLSAANLPVISRNTIKLAEDHVGKAVVETANESCKEAIAEERRLSVVERSDSGIPMDISPGSTPPSSPLSGQETPKTRRRSAAASTPNVEVSTSSPIVDIVVKYDFGWDKRGNGFKYDSHSGRGSMIGEKTNKVLGYEVMSSYCYMCARGLKQENHICAKNYEGSAKGMEPKAAVKLCLQNPDLDTARVRVSTVIGDRDSSTLSALRRESKHDIRKITDLNHNIKTVNNQLWTFKKTGVHKFLTKDIIEYLKRCVNYAITQNAGDVEGVRKGILNVAPHTYGEHHACGEWCKAKNNPSYNYDHLPHSKPFSCPAFRRDLENILAAQAEQAEQLAPAATSLQNESFNHMCNTRAPKSRHYAGTTALRLRVAAAVCTKNYGANHLERTFQKANLSPSVSGFRKSLEQRRVRKSAYQNNPEVKKRRLYLKMKNSWKEAGASQREGYTYVSGMSTTMERAAEASGVSTWLPDVTPLLPNCRPVIVDIETTGFKSTSEIVQISAKCGDEDFNAFIVPRAGFDSGASLVTGMTVQEGRLLRHGERLPTVPAWQAVQDFLDFLKSCSAQVILVGHNIVRFDGPRILKLFIEHGLVKELCSAIFGLTDTLPLISQGKIKKQDVLAGMYLKGREWTDLIKNAHDALADCCILGGLLKHFDVTDADLIESVLPMRDVMERCAANNKKRENRPKLMVMKDHGVSTSMIGKMAAQGVTIEELVAEYSSHGRRGLDVCLGVQLGGKPRVTKSKKVLDQIENFVKTKVPQD